MAIMAMMTTTLMRANQNSNSPNSLTEMRLTVVIHTSASNAGIHCGKSGHQKVQYTPTAVISAMPVTIHTNQ